MWLVVEPDSRGNFSLFAKNVKEEDELRVREDFGEYGLAGVHRPAQSGNIFLRFESKEGAEKALNELQGKYDVVPARPGTSQTANKHLKEDKKGGFQEKRGSFQKRSFPGPANGTPQENDNWSGNESYQRSLLGPVPDLVISEEIATWGIEKVAVGGQKEERTSKGRDLGINGSESWTSKPESGNGFTMGSTSVTQGKDIDGPPPLVHARISQNEKISVYSNLVSPDAPQGDKPPLLIPIKSLESDVSSGPPRLVPARVSQSRASDDPSMSPSVRNAGLESNFYSGVRGHPSARSSLSVPDFIEVDCDDWPKHANQMFIANLSEETSAQDLINIFGPLCPQHVTSLHYTDIKAHIPFRIMTFQSCKAVTFALKYYQNYNLHGKRLNLTRFSTLVEMLN